MSRWAAWCGVWVLCGLASRGQDVRPNVLFIVADDLNGYLGAYGHAAARTPHIDRLAAEGVVFARAMCQFPVCGPSRSSFMTGWRPARTGILSNGPSLFARHPDIETLPRLFRRHGYRTARAGKIYNEIDNRRPGDWDEILDAPIGREGRQRARGGDGDTVDGGHEHWRGEWRAPDCRDDDLPDGANTQAAVDWIGGTGDAPFFLAVGFHKPHQPLVAPKRYFDLHQPQALPRAWERYRDETVPDAARNTAGRKLEAVMTDGQRAGYTLAYHAAVSYIDAQVGRLLDALDAGGHAADTVVVLFGDNGFHVGEHRTWGKNTLFEASARVPLIIRDPAAEGGRTCREVVELVDLFPTLLEMCGLDPLPDLDGRSLVPLVRGRREGEPGGMGVTRVANGWSIRTPRWRLLNIDTAGPEWLLYDMADDPQELRNLGSDPAHADRVRQLRDLAEATGLP